jgi:small-conductance mechanosensitive channel/CRP-like cAMP-binding protein
MPPNVVEVQARILSHLSNSALGIVTTLVTILLCAVAVPKENRREVLRTPLIFFALYLVVVVVSLPIEDGTRLARVLEVAALFFSLLTLSRALFILIIDVLIGRRLAHPLSQIIRDIIQGVVYAGVGAIVLRQVGVEAGSLLTTSALLTAVIGLSLQETLGNLFAGLAIQAQRPFEVGDWIGLDEFPTNMGRVIEINWRATTVLTNDQVELIIPNGILAKATLRNYTKPTKIVRRTVEVDAPYEVSPARVEEALLNAAKDVPGVLETPQPVVLTRNFAASGITYQLQFWIDDFGIRDRLDSSVRQRIWSAFQRAGISIPFPVRTVHMHAQTSEFKEDARNAEVALRKAALENVDFLAALSEELRLELATRSRTCHYMPGEIVLRQGDVGSELYVVQKGEVAVRLTVNDGNIAEVARLGPGKFFGEMSLMTGASRRATVQALNDTQLVEVSKDAFHALLVKDPHLAEAVTEVLVQRQSEIEENLTQWTSENDVDANLKSVALLSKIRNFFAI